MYTSENENESLKSGNASRDLATAIPQDDIANYAKGDRTLSEASLKAADINGDGKITITDLAQLKLVFVGVMDMTKYGGVEK